MFKGPGKTVRDNKSSSYSVFQLTGVNCIFQNHCTRKIVLRSVANLNNIQFLKSN